MIGHININSLSKKTSDVQMLLKKHGQLQVLGITETRLHESKHDDNVPYIPEYSFIRKDAKHKLHTGIGVYVHEGLTQYVRRRHDLENDSIECVWLDIRTPKKSPVLIGFVYRNGKSLDSWFDDFENMFHKVNALNLNTIVLGDFNINLLPEKQNTDFNKKWQLYLNMYGLTQIIKEPTRVEKLGKNITCSLIDHIYVNCEHIIERSFISHHGISDHKAIICSLSNCLEKKHNKNNHKYIIYRSFKSFSPINFLNDLSLINFDSVLHSANPNEAANLFLNLLLAVVDKHAPLRRKRIKYTSNPAWLTNEIRLEMQKRDTLKKTKQFEEYKKQRNKVLTLVRKSKKTYFNQIISNHNSKVISIWRAINEFTKKSHNKQTPSITTSLPVDDINNYFLTLTNSILQTIPKQYEHSNSLIDFIKDKKQTNGNVTFDIPLMSTYLVSKIIKNLKNKRTMDIFNLNAYILKLSISVPQTLSALTHVYNLSILNKIFPDKFKLAKIIPIPKCKDANTLDNYRPISILPILSKPLEIHMNSSLSSFFENNNLLIDSQSGFRKFHSCSTALIKLCDDWLHSINEKKMVGTVFLDLRKAFDLVDHAILLSKLNLYLDNSQYTNLFSSYLQNRFQTVYSNSRFSSLGEINSGVPQGSILGPLLFSIFINDLPLSISHSGTSLDLFADDSTLHTSDVNIANINSNLQESINEIQSWCTQNKMALHPDKTKSMLITTRQKRNHSLKHEPCTLTLNVMGKHISQVSSHKLLGVVIDEDLTWTKHIDHISKKISRNIYLLSQLRHYSNQQGLLIFFHAHCMSHLNYASTVWSAWTSQCNINRLNTLHRRAIKIISTESNISTDQKLRNLNILSLKNQFTFNSVTLMYKVTHQKCPHYLEKLFKSSPRIRVPTYKLPYARIDLFKGSFSFHGVSVWNSLPSQLRRSYIYKLNQFKKNVKQHFLKLQ